jgi:3-dehydroquinate synthase
MGAAHHETLENRKERSEMGLNQHLSLSFPRAAEGYAIWMGVDIIEQMGEIVEWKGISKVGILSDTQVAPLWLERLQSALPLASSAYLVEAGEASKELGILAGIWSWMQAEGMDRESVLLNLGGGMIGDLGGFAAACYLRGIRFLQIPTSLLAQVDASVGGKTGINLNGYKNHLGAFQQPWAVCIDTRYLTTLPQRERAAGMAEVLKHGLIADAAYFEEIAAWAHERNTPEGWLPMIRRSCEIKAQIVQADERESGRRKALNLGHTLGHAFESLSHDAGMPLLHGEAVGLGLLAEAQIAHLRGDLHERDVEAIKAALLRHQLPTRLPFSLDRAAMWRYLMADKKASGGRIGWVLLKQLGLCCIDQSVAPQLVEQAIESVL